MSQLEKIKIYLPESISNILLKDMALFEFIKDNGELNKNRFLCNVIKGYHDIFSNERDELRNKIENSFSDESHTSVLVDTILQNIYFDTAVKKKGSRKIVYSLKPTDEIERIILKIRSELGSFGSESGYYCKLLSNYSEKPLWERERIVFRNKFESLQRACESGRTILLYSRQNKLHPVIPYEIVYSQDEMFNYLICQEINLETGGPIAMSYRLNRISGWEYSSYNSRLDSEVKVHLEKMKSYSPQFAINDDEEASIWLSEEGLFNFGRIYHGRPKYEKIEKLTDGYKMHFNCSKDQIFLYFRRFNPGCSEILSPAWLRNKMIEYHNSITDDYNNNSHITIK